MPSGLRKTEGNNFEIYYEKPWGGVASDAADVDLQPNELQVQQGVVDIDGQLCQFNMVSDPKRFVFQQAGITDPNVAPFVIFAIQGQIFACDQFGGLYVYNNTLNPIVNPAGFIPLQVSSSIHTQLKAPDLPWAGAPEAVQVIDGSAYIGNPANHSIYKFTPGNPNTFVVASNYTGGFFMGVLTDYLLQINTNNNTDGLQPNRVNWSAPGAFSTWDPAIDRTAGFNTLASIDDQLVGFLSYANVGVILSKKALIEVSPTGVGVSPFSFTALWNSVVGQGVYFPDSITQWGQKGFATTDSGVYEISTGSGFVDVSAKARTAIFGSFQYTNLNQLQGLYANTLIAATVMIYAYNSLYPTPFYVIAAVTKTNLGIPQTVIFWLFDLIRGTWTKQAYSVDALVNTQYGTSLNGGAVILLKAVTLDANVVSTFDVDVSVQGTFANPITMFWMVVQYGTGVPVLYPVILTPYIYNKKNQDININPPTTLNLVFRAEEVKLGYTRKPTIRRVVVKAYGSGTLSINITDVNGTVYPFGSIVLDGTNNSRTYYSPTGMATIECPTLSISSTNFKGVIIKAMMAGTFADGEID